MKQNRIHRISITAVAIAFAICAASLTDSAAKPGGRYDCTAKKLRFNGLTWGGGTRLLLRIPNGKGRVRGSFKGHQSSIGLGGGATPIVGRVINSRSARGGKRYILRGKWTWKLKRNFLSGNARGNFRFVVDHQAKGGYQIKAPLRIRSAGPMSYLVIGDIKGE